MTAPRFDDRMRRVIEGNGVPLSGVNAVDQPRRWRLARSFAARPANPSPTRPMVPGSGIGHKHTVRGLMSRIPTMCHRSRQSSAVEKNSSSSSVGQSPVLVRAGGVTACTPWSSVPEPWSGLEQQGSHRAPAKCSTTGLVWPKRLPRDSPENGTPCPSEWMSSHRETE